MSFIVYPAVDIADGRCVRSLQGRLGAETVYSDDPIEVALGFCRAGARWLHIVDLDGAKHDDPRNRELMLEVVKIASCPVQAGGGLRTLDDVEEVLAAGAQRAVVSTVALEDPDALATACKRYGGRIAVSLDARGSELTTHGWTVGAGVPLLQALRAFENAGVAQFNYTDVERDGSMSGPNIERLVALAGETKLPVVASGGISSLADLRAVARLHEVGVAGAIVGRALYEDKFSLMDAIRAADQVASGRYEFEMERER